MGNAKNSPGGYGRTICSQLCSQFALSGQCAHRGAIGSCSGWMVGKPHLYSPELEPHILLTQPHASGVDETCTPFGDRRRWQHSVALDGSIPLHWMAA